MGDDDYDDFETLDEAAITSPKSIVSADAGLEYCPNSVEIVTTKVDGYMTNPAYIMKVFTPAGEVWAVSRRFDAFKKLRNKLTGKGSGAIDQTLASIPFPDKVEALVGKDTPEASQTRQMKEQLSSWINAIIGLSPGNTDLVSFLARDNSVGAKFARDALGLQVSAAELAADRSGGRAAGQALQEVMNGTKISDIDAQPERVVITEALIKTGDEERKTQTEQYTVYKLLVYSRRRGMGARAALLGVQEPARQTAQGRQPRRALHPLPRVQEVRVAARRGARARCRRGAQGPA